MLTSIIRKSALVLFDYSTQHVVLYAPHARTHKVLPGPFQAVYWRINHSKKYWFEVGRIISVEFTCE